MFEAMPCIVELFGHQRIAGRVSDQQLGGSALLRVDVPEVDGQKGFTKFYGTGAIYAITPVSEETMLQAVRALRPVPIERWVLETRQIPSVAGRADPDDYDDYDEDDDDDGY